MARITISHTRTEGTIVNGTARGDGTAAILKAAGFRWAPSLRAWIIAQSRDQAAKTWKIDRAAADLRAAGFEVKVSIDETPRAFAEAEAERQVRADRYAERAERASAAAAAAYQAAHAELDLIPLGPADPRRPPLRAQPPRRAQPDRPAHASLDRGGRQGHPPPAGRHGRRPLHPAPRGARHHAAPHRQARSRTAADRPLHRRGPRARGQRLPRPGWTPTTRRTPTSWPTGGRSSPTRRPQAPRSGAAPTLPRATRCSTTSAAGMWYSGSTPRA